MLTDRKNAVIVGLLFIIATGFLYLGEAVYGPFLSGSDYLQSAYPNRALATVGMLIEFVCVVAIPLIAVFLFPVLRRSTPRLAVGYVGFRFFEAVLFANVEINKLSFINLSHQLLGDDTAAAGFARSLGGEIQATNDWMFAIYVIIFGIGALMLYSALYRSKVVPRFISVWGFLAGIVIIIGALFGMIFYSANTTGVAWSPVFFAPIAINEMVLAVWLIVKGFDSQALSAEATS